MEQAEELLKLFVKKGLTLSLAESCTGGRVAARIVSIVDASKYFLGGIVAYSNEAKMKLLNVKESTLQLHGAVSEETALEMAIGCRKAFGSDIALSTTGIAGPSGATESKPVGQVCFGIAYSEKIHTYTKFFNGDRKEIISLATNEALKALYCLIS